MNTNTIVVVVATDTHALIEDQITNSMNEIIIVYIWAFYICRKKLFPQTNEVKSTFIIIRNHCEADFLQNFGSLFKFEFEF